MHCIACCSKHGPDGHTVQYSLKSFDDEKPEAEFMHAALSESRELG